MATYTIAECPEISVTVRGKDSSTVRQKALDKIIELMDAEELPTELPDGLSAEQLIEVKEQPNNSDINTNEAEEDAVVKAVRELNNLANLKIKVEELHQVAVKARKDLGILFTDAPIEQEVDQLKDLLKSSFKILKDFAAASASYKEAKINAENARAVLDEALQFNETKSKSEFSTDKAD